MILSLIIGMRAVYMSAFRAYMLTYASIIIINYVQADILTFSTLKYRIQPSQQVAVVVDMIPVENTRSLL